MSTVQSVDRAFAILECFDAQHTSRNVNEIAELTGLARPTIYRLLQTLGQLGYVQHTHGSYRLAARVLRLADAYAGPLGLAGAAQPILDQLADALDEHVAIGVLDGPDVITIGVARSANSRLLAVAVDVGQRLPAADTSLGRVLLAHAEQPIGGAPADRDEIIARGYAVSDGLLETGLRSLGVPVCDRDGTVVASISVAVNAARVPADELERRHLPVMRDAAERLRQRS